MLDPHLGHLPIRFEAAQADQIGTLLTETFKTFAANFGSIVKVTAVVFLPLELIKSYAIYSAGSQENFLMVTRIDMFLESIFGSLVIPALIYAVVAKSNTGLEPPLKEAFSWGFRQWGRTFGNRWLAGMAMLGGLILLVVPGIVLAVWFVFVPIVVAIEGDHQPHVLTRSRDLTKGHRWMIFFTGAGLLGLVVILSTVLTMPLFVWDYWYVNAGIDLALGILYQVLTIAFLVAYLSFTAVEHLPDVFD